MKAFKLILVVFVKYAHTFSHTAWCMERDTERAIHRISANQQNVWTQHLSVMVLHPWLDYTIGPFVQRGGAFVSPGVDVSSVRHSKMHATPSLYRHARPVRSIQTRDCKDNVLEVKTKLRFKGIAPVSTKIQENHFECHLTHSIKVLIRVSVFNI